MANDLLNEILGLNMNKKLMISVLAGAAAFFLGNMAFDLYISNKNKTAA